MTKVDSVLVNRVVIQWLLRVCILWYRSVAFADEKVMKNYQRGEPSTTLYVKNLAKDVQESDLIAIFGAVVPADTSQR